MALVFGKEVDIRPQAMDGYIFTLKSIQNKTFSCGDCLDKSLYKEETTHDCYKAPCKIKNWRFDAIEVVMNIIATNESNGDWSVDSRDVRIIDGDGFVYEGRTLCDKIASAIHRANEDDRVAKCTQANMIYYYQLIPVGKEVCEVLVANGNESLRFVIKNSLSEESIFSSNYYASILSGSNSIGHNNEVSGLGREIIIDKLKTLKVRIYKRLNNTLLSTEAKSLEEKIETSIYSLGLDLESAYTDSSYSDLAEDFRNTVNDYRRDLEVKSIREEEQEIGLTKVSELVSIDPFKFEHICAAILEKQGFNNIRVTQKTNDKGVDIVATKFGQKYVVQCKRYKNTVGSPEMQTFVGAMKNSGAERGLFMTTGTFTREAELMAMANSIELIDRTRLSTLLNLVDDGRGEGATIWDK